MIRRRLPVTAKSADPSVLFSLENLVAYEAELRAAAGPTPAAVRLSEAGLIDLQRLSREPPQPIVPVDHEAERAKARTLLMIGIAALCGAAIVLATMAVAEPPPIVVRYVTGP